MLARSCVHVVTSAEFEPTSLWLCVNPVINWTNLYWQILWYLYIEETHFLIKEFIYLFICTSINNKTSFSLFKRPFRIVTSFLKKTQKLNLYSSNFSYFSLVLIIKLFFILCFVTFALPTFPLFSFIHIIKLFFIFYFDLSLL